MPNTELPDPVITRFWIEETDYSDLEHGYIEWSDGSTSYQLDVLKDPEVLTEFQRSLLHALLNKVMIGLRHDQIMFMYEGVLENVFQAADPEYFKALVADHDLKMVVAS